MAPERSDLHKGQRPGESSREYFRRISRKPGETPDELRERLAQELTPPPATPSVDHGQILDYIEWALDHPEEARGLKYMKENGVDLERVLGQGDISTLVDFAHQVTGVHQDFFIEVNGTRYFDEEAFRQDYPNGVPQKPAKKPNFFQRLLGKT